MSEIEFNILCFIFCPSVVAIITMHCPYVFYGLAGVSAVFVYIYLSVIYHSRKG